MAIPRMRRSFDLRWLVSVLVLVVLLMPGTAVALSPSASLTNFLSERNARQPEWAIGDRGVVATEQKTRIAPSKGQGTAISRAERLQEATGLSNHRQTRFGAARMKSRSATPQRFLGAAIRQRRGRP